MEKDMIGSGVAKEIEILEFRAGGNSYGVDVNDIREILPYQKKSLPIPNAPSGIEGIIKPRDFLIPIVNFMHCLKLNETDELKTEMLIVTSIANLNIAFHVDSVKGIHRVMTTDISKPGKKLSTAVKGAVIGILPREERKIEVVEFRKIINDINPQVNVG